MITLFNVQSSRIRDINILTGTTVGELRRLLKDKGLDVKDAFVAVNRAKTGDKLIGETDSYKLLPGDTVEFSTKEISLPNTARLVAREQRKTEEHKARSGQVPQVVFSFELYDNGVYHVTRQVAG